MAGLIIPQSVGGTAAISTTPKVVGMQPGLDPEVEQVKAQELLIPQMVGGTYQQEPQQPAIPQQRPVDVDQVSEFMATPGMEPEGGFVDSLKMAAGMMFASNDEAKKDIIRENFPGVKITEQKTKEGEDVTLIVLPDGTETVLNKPGFSYQDVYSFLGDMAAFYGPSKAAGLAKGLAKKIAIGGVAAGSIQAGLEKSVQVLGSKQEVDPKSVALATGLGAGAEVVGPAVKGFFAGRQAKKAGAAVEDFAEAVTGVQEAERLTSKTGIPLFRAQKTGVLTDLERQSYIASLPGGSRKAVAELKNQNEKAYQAVMDALDKIAPAEKIEGAAGKVRDVAKQALDAKKAIRNEKASPLYKEAFENKSPVNVTKTKGVIKGIRDNYPESGDVAKVLDKIEAKLRGKKTVGEDGAVSYAKPTAKVLHGAKLEIDDMLSKFGEGSLGNVQKREVLTIKNSLLSELDEVNPAYKEAREIFAENSPAVNELQDSIVGKLSKLDDTQLKTISGKLFGSRDTAFSPDLIKKSKKIIESQDPQAWKDITRAELEKRLGSMKADIGEGSIENIPGQLYRAVFGNMRQRKALYAALDKDTAKNVRYLQEALKKASLGRPGGSQTAARQQIDKELRGGVSGAISTIFSPAASVKEGLKGYGIEAKQKALANVLFDPKWMPKLKELRGVKPSSNKAKLIMKEILDQALRDLPKPAVQAIAPDIEQSPLSGSAR